MRASGSQGRGERKFLRRLGASVECTCPEYSGSNGESEPAQLPEQHEPVSVLRAYSETSLLVVLPVGVSVRS